MARDKYMYIDIYNDVVSYGLRTVDNPPFQYQSLPSDCFTIVNSETNIHEDVIFVNFPDVSIVCLTPYVGGFWFDASSSHVYIADHFVCYDAQSFVSFSGVPSGLVDLTPIFTQLSQIETNIINLLTPLQTAELNNLHEDIVSLGTQLSTVSVPLQSLNGNGSEYKDGVQVSVTGRSIPYTVSRSYMSLMNTDTYTIVYDLTSADGSKVTCPESFLTLYVAPVVTP